jgi:hypothetical protein
MIANIDPLYMRHQKSDVVYTKTKNTWDCHDYNPVPIFFNSLTRFLNSREIFVWDVYLKGSNFWDLIKNQIHIFPSLYVDFGLVLSQREIGYYIWNSWSDKSVFILEPVAIGDYGTTFVIDIAGNFTLQSGKGTPAVLTVFTEGPISSTTDFEITYTVEGQSAKTFTISTKATRVIVFPLWADWSKKVEYKIKFQTAITSSTENYEQRRPLVAKPQRAVSFTHLDKPYGLVSNAMNFAQDKSIGIPIVHELFQVTAIDSDRMGFSLWENVDTLWNLKRFCNYVMLYDRSTGILVAKKITSKTESKIFVENPILEEFPNVSSVVGFPMIIGVFTSAKPTILNGNLISWDLVLSELIGENQPELVNIPTLPSALLTKFDWEEKVSFEQKLYRDIGEFVGTSQTVYSKFPQDKNSLKDYTGTFIFRTRSELCSFLDFVCAAKGRAFKFEYLWPMNEFQIIRGEYEGVNQLRARNNYFAEQQYKVLNKKVVIYYRGNVFGTTITSATNNSEYTYLNLEHSTPFRIYDADCENVRIEQYKTVRFDLDEFSIECLSGTVFKATVRLMEVYQ